MATIIIDLDDNQIQAIMHAFGRLPIQRLIYELIDNISNVIVLRNNRLIS